MNQEKSAGHSTAISEHVHIGSFRSPEPIETGQHDLGLLSEDYRIDQLQALRWQLIRKNRLLADLKRQLSGAQNIINQLHCITDPQVTVALQLYERVTDNSISFIDCVKSAMQEFDSSSERMSYLIKQLKREEFSNKF